MEILASGDSECCVIPLYVVNMQNLHTVYHEKYHIVAFCFMIYVQHHEVASNIPSPGCHLHMNIVKLISLLKDDAIRISREGRKTDSILILICTLMHHSKLQMTLFKLKGQSTAGMTVVVKSNFPSLQIMGFVYQNVHKCA